MLSFDVCCCSTLIVYWFVFDIVMFVTVMLVTYCHVTAALTVTIKRRLHTYIHNVLKIG